MTRAVNYGYLARGSGTTMFIILRGHLGERPRDWYGPEDWDGVNEPTPQRRARERLQQAWDYRYRSIPWYKKLVFYFGADVRAPSEIYPDEHY